MSIKVSNFILQDQIGHGGMGVVFKAFDKLLGRDVAIKMLFEEKSEDQEFVQNFLIEAKNAASITHPNIVNIYSIGEETGKYFMVMELLQGLSLDEHLKKFRILSERHMLQIAIDIVKALKAVYDERHLIHGDIKPQNIFLTTSGTNKILDFGLAKKSNLEVIPQGYIIGSAHYVSPERVHERTEDFRSDMYSLGACLYHALTGTPPFVADTSEELILKRTHEIPASVRLLCPEASELTEKIIHKMLEKSPLMRHLDYADLLKDLEEAYKISETHEVPLNPYSAVIEKPKTTSLRLWGWLLFIGVILAGFSLSQFLLPETSSLRIFSQKESAKEISSSPVNSLAVNILFSIKKSEAKEAFIIGNFTNWEPVAMKKQKNAAWRFIKAFPIDYKVEYYYLLDGKRVCDTKFPVSIDAKGEQISSFTVDPSMDHSQ